MNSVINWLALDAHNLKISKWALEENLFFSSHREQVVKKSNRNPLKRLAELKQSFQSQSCRAFVLKIEH